MFKLKHILFTVALMAFITSSSYVFAAPQQPAPAVPRGWINQGGGGNGGGGGERGGARGGNRELAMARGELSRYVLGIPELEKDKKLAITKDQAKALKPVVMSIKNNKLLESVGFQDMRDPKTGKIDEAKRAKLAKAMANSGKLSMDAVKKIEAILNSKQLGGIDGMDFPGLGFGVGRGGSQGQGNGQRQGSQGGQGFRSSGGGGGWGVGGGQRPSQAQMEEFRKKFEEQQKKTAEMLKKSLNNLINLIDKKAK